MAPLLHRAAITKSQISNNIIVNHRKYIITIRFICSNNSYFCLTYKGKVMG